MQIDKQTDKIKPCECGYKPEYYSIGYGDAPYYISCIGCGKSLHDGKDDVNTIINQWNRDYRKRKSPGVMFHLPPNSKLKHAGPERADCK
jgi:hypothetical protein